MNVFEIQSHLRDMGFYRGPVDGKAGTQTRMAISAALEKYAPTHRIPDGNGSRLLIGAEQMIMKQIGGLAVGPIDGIAGALTTKARTHWANGPWRASIMQALPGDERMPLMVKNTWPKQSEMAAYFGAPGTNQTMFYSPYPLRLYDANGPHITRFQCNNKVRDSLGIVLSRVLADYGYDAIQDLRLDVFSGCLNVRPMRGGKTLSTHAYGAAVDWDANRNALKSDHTRAAFAKPAYERWWAAWTAQGWLSLGKARDFDWMHVQAARLG